MKGLNLLEGSLQKRKSFDPIPILAFLVAFVAIVFLLGLCVSLLWNWLMPTIFGLVKINWLQAVGLVILFSTLTGIGSKISK